MKKLTLLLASVSLGTMADTVRLSDGNSCSFDADDSPWELSLITSARDGQGKRHDAYHDRKGWDKRNDYEVGAEISYKFGGPTRLDCSKLYNIQLNMKNAELKLLKQKLQILESQASINWDN